jgi:microcystin-dependent protein
MPYNGSGIYSLPVGYFVQNGDTLEPSQHNPIFEDVAQALSSVLLRSGVAGMTGNLPMAGNKITDLGAPTNPNDAVRLQDAQLLAVPVGAGMDFWGGTAPTNFMFAYGQAISRTTYATCFAQLGTTYGAGDGSTTFNLPDKRGRASFGKDNMGGVAAGRLTTGDGRIAGNTLGAVGGLETHTLTTAQLAVHTHSASTASGGTHTHTAGCADSGNHAHTLSIDSAGAHTHTYTAPQATIFFAGGSGQNVPSINVGATTSSAGAHTHTGATNTTGLHNHVITVNSGGAHTHGVTVDNAGSGQAHNNVPPGIVCNYIIRVI